MKASVIQHLKEERLVLLRQGYLAICEGHFTAAKLLSLFEFWTNVKLRTAEENQAKNEQLTLRGLEPTHPTDLWIYKTYEALRDDLLREPTRRKISDGLQLLRKLGFIETRTDPAQRWDRTAQYRLNASRVTEALVQFDTMHSPHRDDASPPIQHDASCQTGSIDSSYRNDRSAQWDRSTLTELTPEIKKKKNTLHPHPLNAQQTDWGKILLRDSRWHDVDLDGLAQDIELLDGTLDLDMEVVALRAATWLETKGQDKKGSDLKRFFLDWVINAIDKKNKNDKKPSQPGEKKAGYY